MVPKLKGRFREIASLNSTFDNKKIKVAGIVTKVQKVITRNREPMAFMRLEDLSGSLEVIIFPNLMTNHADLLVTDKVLLVEGKVNVKDRVTEEGDEMTVRSEAKLVADSLIEITDEYLAKMPALLDVDDQPELSRLIIQRWQFSDNNLLIKIPQGFNGEKLKSLKGVLERHPGGISVELEVFANGQQQRLKTTTRTAQTPELEQELADILS